MLGLTSSILAATLFGACPKQEKRGRRQAAGGRRQAAGQDWPVDR